MLTYREWAILQYGLLALECSLRNEAAPGGPPSRVSWDEGEDGPPPAHREVAALAAKVGDMPHGRAEPRAVAPPCPHPGDSAMGRTEDAETPGSRSRVTDPRSVLTALLLTDAGLKPGSALEHDVDALKATVEGWTDDQRAAAFEWAALEHLAAGDNDVDRVPCPPHVQATRPDYAGKVRNG